ncbi:MAG: YceI family protein [Bacteroidota bacterium]
MKNIVSFSLTLLFLFSLTFSHAQNKVKWKIDNDHSSVKFNVTHLVVSTVTGGFTEFEGQLVSGENDDFSGSSVNATIMVNSVDTENMTRDKHLKDEDFFHAEKYPEIKFVSTSFEKKDRNTYSIKGDLTIRDVTKEVELTAEFGGKINAYDKTLAGFSIKGSINRFDFGLKWDDTLDGGSLIVGEEVELDLDVELVKM